MKAFIRAFRRKRILFILSISGLAVGIALIVWPREHEPEYEGRSLSQWLMAYAQAVPHSMDEDPSEDAQEAADAVRHIGTNALPCLLKWRTYELPPWRLKLCDAVDRIYKMCYGCTLPEPSYSLPWPYRAALGQSQIRSDLVIPGFEILGSEAAPAVPELARLLASGDGSAAAALAAIGHAGLPPLLTVLADPEAPERANAAYCIGRLTSLGTNAAPAVPLLIQCLDDKDPWVAHAGASSLGALALEPRLAVPALTGSLQHSNRLVRYMSARSLQAFGTEALPALPALRAALSDRDGVVRIAATNALKTLAPTELPDL